MSQSFSKDYWDKHYHGIGQSVGQPKASPYLANEISELAPGLALDAGCGEGADAMWLARHGWKVEAVDISNEALDEAKKVATKSGAKVDFNQVDLTTWLPQENYYDLITSLYVHTTDNSSFIKKLGNAVSPGGTLLIVGHQPPKAGEAGSHAHDSYITAEEIASCLNADEWRVEIAEPRTVTKMSPTNEAVLLYDAVFMAQKLVNAM